MSEIFDKVQRVTNTYMAEQMEEAAERDLNKWKALKQAAGVRYATNIDGRIKLGWWMKGHECDQPTDYTVPDPPEGTLPERLEDCRVFDGISHKHVYWWADDHIPLALSNFRLAGTFAFSFIFSMLSHGQEMLNRRHRLRVPISYGYSDTSVAGTRTRQRPPKEDQNESK